MLCRRMDEKEASVRNTIVKSEYLFHEIRVRNWNPLLNALQLESSIETLQLKASIECSSAERLY